jgi:hypothetical protein
MEWKMKKKFGEWRRREINVANVNERSKQKRLTIFTTPKSFHGHIGIIQTNAIQSWLLLRPECEVILFGNGEGTAEVAAKFGLRHIPEVECNEYGTPFISSMFRIAQDVASHQLMCYVNADIILMSDFLLSIRQIQWQSFLLIGRRWDIDLKEPLDFVNREWEEHLGVYLAEVGTLHGLSGLDYFVFPRGMYRDIPLFAVGRPGWDNWMVYKARYLKVPVIDATKAITAVHQNHDYPHHLKGENGVWKGPERKRNIELMGGRDHGFTLEHATWIFTSQGIRRGLTPRHLYFRLDAVPMLVPHLHFLRRPMKALTRLIIHIRSMLGIAQS